MTPSSPSPTVYATRYRLDCAGGRLETRSARHTGTRKVASEYRQTSPCERQGAGPAGTTTSSLLLPAPLIHRKRTKLLPSLNHVRHHTGRHQLPRGGTRIMRPTERRLIEQDDRRHGGPLAKERERVQPREIGRRGNHHDGKASPQRGGDI